MGTMLLDTVVDDGPGRQICRSIRIPNVHVVPGLSVTLLSLSQLIRSGNTVRFEANAWTVTKGKRRRPVFQAREHNGVYQVLTPNARFKDAVASAFVAAVQQEAIMQAHRRLGHLNFDDCRRLALGTSVSGINISRGPAPPKCTSCALANATIATAPRSRTSDAAAADSVCHVDLSGTRAKSYHGNTFYMVAVWRGYICVYGLKSKDQAAERTKYFLRFIERQAKVPAPPRTSANWSQPRECVTSTPRAIAAARTESPSVPSAPSQKWPPPSSSSRVCPTISGKKRCSTRPISATGCQNTASSSVRQKLFRSVPDFSKLRAFTLVDPPRGPHILNNTVQFRLKTGPDGNIVQHKARVCARGDLQIYMIDYVKAHAPVADLVCVRMLLVIAMEMRMKLRQGDVPAAYLKADVKETIYARQVEGSEAPGEEQKVWKLNKALCGLKQAGREWNLEIDGYLKQYGLKVSKGDTCLYHMTIGDGLLLVCLYVDDILVVHPDEAQVDRLMATLATKYQVKDLGPPAYFLGMKIEQRGRSEIRLPQSAYIEELLHRFAMDPVRPTQTPIVPNTRLDTLTDEPREEEVEYMKDKPYRQAVGSLLYLARVTRPDIAFAVNQIARHCAKPRREAWHVVKYLLRYISGTKDVRLRPKRVGSDLRLATDSDWANDKEDHKSVSGYVLFLFGAPVAWGSTKQTVVALSSTAAEFIAANDGLQQADWVQLMVEGILVSVQRRLPLTLQVDNQPTIHRIKKAGTSGAQKAVDIHFHALKDAWQAGNMALEYIPTQLNPADLLTKALAHTELHRKRTLCCLAAQASGDDL